MRANGSSPAKQPSETIGGFLNPRDFRGEESMVAERRLQPPDLSRQGLQARTQWAEELHTFFQLDERVGPPVGQSLRGFGATRGQQDTNTLSAGRITGPVRFVSKLLEDWRLDDRATCALLGFEESDVQYVQDLLSGRISLRGRDVRHRIALLLQVRETLDGLFRNLDVEND